MVVKAAPAAALKVAEPDLLLELLIITLDPPARLGGVHQVLERGVRGQVGEPVFGRFRLTARPFDQQPFLRPGFTALFVAMGRADAQGEEARGQRGLAAFTPCHRPPGAQRLRRGQRLDRHRLVFRAAAQPLRRPSLAGPSGRQGCQAWRPDTGARAHGQNVGQIKRGHTDPQIGVITVFGIGQHHTGRHAIGPGLADLPQRDRHLGLERDRLWHTGFGPPDRILSPGLGQIKLVGNRQAGLIIGHREADRDLAIVLLAKLAAVLPRHANRMLTFLRKRRAIDDPISNRPVLLDRRHHLLAHRMQHCRVIPLSLGHHVMQRLMCGLDLSRFHPGRHRLDALALTRQQQPRAIRPCRRYPAGMAQHLGDPTQIRGKPILTRRGLSCGRSCHTSHIGKN